MIHRIHSATAADIDGIVELFHDLEQYHRGFDQHLELRRDASAAYRDFLAATIADPSYVRYVATVGGRTVGYAEGQIFFPPPIFEQRKAGRMVYAYVLPDHRRHGICTDLHERCFEGFRRASVGVVEFVVVAQNTTMLGYLRDRGAVINKHIGYFELGGAS